VTEQVATVTPDVLRAHLEQTALDVETPGFDFLTGSGLIQLVPLPTGGGGGGGGGGTFPPDVAEPNDTSDAADNEGPLVGSQTLSNLTIGQTPTGLPDYDWYRWSAGTSGTLTATLTTTAGGSLELHLFTLSGNTLVELSSSTAPGLGTRTATGSFSAGDAILVEVKGRNSSPGVVDQGAYNLT